jgi:hypothetical protein
LNEPRKHQFLNDNLDRPNSFRFGFKIISTTFKSILTKIWRPPFFDLAHYKKKCLLSTTERTLLLTAMNFFQVPVQVYLFEVNLRTELTLDTVLRRRFRVHHPNMAGQIFPILENLVALVAFHFVGVRLHVRAHTNLVDEQSTVVALDFDSQIYGFELSS